MPGRRAGVTGSDSEGESSVLQIPGPAEEDQTCGQRDSVHIYTRSQPIRLL